MVPEGQDQNDDEEIEKQPLELEDMLELFREPEEPPRKGFNPMWLVLALVVVVGGCWLAITGVQAFVEQMSGLQGGTPKAGKSGERVSEAAANVDVQTAFRERCAKGMTKDEVRWILQDFEKMGLTEELEPLQDISTKVIHGDSDEMATSAERDLLKFAVLKMAAREREWYADTLAEALMLDREQKAELKEKLAVALAGETKQFERVEMAFRLMDGWQANPREPSEQERQELKDVFELAGAEPFGRSIVYFSVAWPELWVQSDAYAPWDLCQLSPDQLAITNYKHVSAQHGENATAGWLMAPEIEGTEGIELRLPYFLQKPAGILPLTAEQILPHNEDSSSADKMSIGVLTKLHPAQFKLLLLCYPELAEDIRLLLEKE
jgi:hypothetical protein